MKVSPRTIVRFSAESQVGSRAVSLHSALQQILVQSNPYGHSHIGCPQAHPLFLCTTFTKASCVDSFTLPNPDDRHVLAAALAGHAANVRDFPAAIVGAYGIEVVHPDRFIVNQWDLEPLVAIAAFRRMRARRKRPRTSVEDFAMALEQNGLPLTAQRIREAAELL